MNVLIGECVGWLCVYIYLSMNVYIETMVIVMKAGDLLKTTKFQPNRNHAFTAIQIRRFIWSHRFDGHLNRNWNVFCMWIGKWNRKCFIHCLVGRRDSLQTSLKRDKTRMHKAKEAFCVLVMKWNQFEYWDWMSNVWSAFGSWNG